MKVLVVDEGAEVRNGYKELLQDYEHMVKTAGNVWTAEQLLSSMTFDLVICDPSWYLPGDGIEFVLDLSRRGYDLIVVSATLESLQQDKIREAGIIYIPKNLKGAIDLILKAIEGFEVN